jgi:predicted CopG family antitoxin
VFYTYVRPAVRKKLTITVDEEVYDGLHRVIGRRHISRFLNELAKPHVVEDALEEGYRAMAADEEREREAAEWSEGLIGDVADDPR